MTNKLLFAAISTSLLCGWLPFQVVVAAEPDAPPATTVTTSAVDAAAHVPTPSASVPTAAEGVVQAPPAVAASPVAASAASTSAAAAKPAAPTGDDEIVCKKQDVFGSRVRKTKICRTKREWQMEAQAAKDYTKGINKGSAPGPGGEGLPVGG